VGLLICKVYEIRHIENERHSTITMINVTANFEGELPNKCRRLISLYLFSRSECIDLPQCAFSQDGSPWSILEPTWHETPPTLALTPTTASNGIAVSQRGREQLEDVTWHLRGGHRWPLIAFTRTETPSFPLVHPQCRQLPDMEIFITNNTCSSWYVQSLPE